jgi:hypothetical protein
MNYEDIMEDGWNIFKNAIDEANDLMDVHKATIEFNSRTEWALIVLGHRYADEVARGLAINRESEKIKSKRISMIENFQKKIISDFEAIVDFYVSTKTKPELEKILENAQNSLIGAESMLKQKFSISVIPGGAREGWIRLGRWICAFKSLIATKRVKQNFLIRINLFLNVYQYLF